MKQFLQSVRDGFRQVREVPAPRAGPKQVLVRTAASLVSAGTERLAVEFAGKNLLQKAWSRPDLVREVIAKTKAEGVLNAVQAAWNRLDRPQSLGYSSAGTVVATGEGVNTFVAGDRVACAGVGYAVHAEFVAVPVNLVVHIPPGVREITFDEAAFTTLGAVALHALRLAEAVLGETVAVIGLGLVGLIAAQLARAGGCRVVGMDPDPGRCRIAEQLGCASVTEESAFSALVESCSKGRGADAVLITAATDSDAPVALAGEIARARGRVVATGQIGTRIPRRTYYEKELDFRISRSYGPGRYDPEFEEHGHDYPVAYVRWTETRNMEAFLELLAASRLDVLPLITHRFPIERAAEAYDLLAGKAQERYLGVLITYDGETQPRPTVELQARAATAVAGKVGIGLIGAGSFATAVLAPALQRVPGVELAGVCAATGASARHAGEKFGFRYCTTETQQILADAAVQAVVIATRHHLHARQVTAALHAGKHVFVEKPLAISESELDEVLAAAQHNAGILMVGFNRRFAPLAGRLKKFFAPVREPLLVHYRANAGRIPAEHWTQHPEQGGRIVGEACHFVDFAGWLIGENPVSVTAESLPQGGAHPPDNVILTLRYPNGSLAVVHYIASGDRRLGKERVEVHGGGRSGVLEDFRRLELCGGERRVVERSWLSQDKGHSAECEAFVRAVQQGGPSPIPLADLAATTRATLLAVKNLQAAEAIGLARGPSR
jgi:predicted dehydrogenase